MLRASLPWKRYAQLVDDNMISDLLNKHNYQIVSLDLPRTEIFAARASRSGTLDGEGLVNGRTKSLIRFYGRRRWHSFVVALVAVCLVIITVTWSARNR